VRATQRATHHIVTSYPHLQERNRGETARMLDPLVARRSFFDLIALNGYRR
jgi:hypothetical protein